MGDRLVSLAVVHVPAPSQPRACALHELGPQSERGQHTAVIPMYSIPHGPSLVRVTVHGAVALLDGVLCSWWARYFAEYRGPNRIQQLFDYCLSPGASHLQDNR